MVPFVSESWLPEGGVYSAGPSPCQAQRETQGEAQRLSLVP